MRSGLTATVFATVLWAALCFTSVFDVYVLGHFEATLGDRFDNLSINALGDVLVAFVVAIGFAGYLFVRRIKALPVSLWVSPAASGLVAGLLVYVVALFLGQIPDLFGYPQVNIFVFVVFCLALGALAAAVVARLAFFKETS